MGHLGGCQEIYPPLTDSWCNQVFMDSIRFLISRMKKMHRCFTAITLPIHCILMSVHHMINDRIGRHHPSRTYQFLWCKPGFTGQHQHSSTYPFPWCKPEFTGQHNILGHTNFSGVNMNFLSLLHKSLHYICSAKHTIQKNTRTHKDRQIPQLVASLLWRGYKYKLPHVSIQK